MAKILITGGAGFIGANLCRRFLKDGHSVICVDNFLSGSRSNVEELLSNPSFKLVEHDVCQPLPNDFGKIDAIFHFACPASPNPSSPVSYMNYPVETLMVNTLGAQRMLELAHSNNSNSLVVGEQVDHHILRKLKQRLSDTYCYVLALTCAGHQAC